MKILLKIFYFILLILLGVFQGELQSLIFPFPFSILTSFIGGVIIGYVGTMFFIDYLEFKIDNL